MNINQQAEIEELFRRINKSIQKNNKSKINDEDLNKVRAYVVQSQRPLQAVRLLQKEREERETDDKFSTQKEDIIQQAQELERRKNDFKKEQQNMINYVREQISVITQNANKRKNEEQKLEDEKRNIQIKKDKIEELEGFLEKKKQLLHERRQELEKHKKFNKFLEDVVNDSGDNKEFQDIDDLQNRFKNLKNENAKLMRRKVQINKEMEDARLREKTTLSNLQNNLYEMQRKMQNLQQQLEQISEKNSALEQDFENEINKKNKNSKEIGQIINSINNICEYCRKQQIKRTRIKTQKDDVNEKTPNLVGVLIEKLETSKEVIEDLVEVFKIIDSNYDRDKAYTEGLFNNTKLGQPGVGQSTGMIKSSNAKGGATTGTNDTTAKVKQGINQMISDASQKLKQGSGLNKEELAKSGQSQQLQQ